MAAACAMAAGDTKAAVTEGRRGEGVIETIERLRGGAGRVDGVATAELTGCCGVDASAPLMAHACCCACDGGVDSEAKRRRGGAAAVPGVLMMAL